VAWTRIGGPRALALLTFCSGAFTVPAGVARFGRYTRFVSHSVMTGFLTGVALNIALGQLPDLVGANASGPFALAKALDLVEHLGRVQLASLATGLGALLVLVLAPAPPVLSTSRRRWDRGRTRRQGPGPDRRTVSAGRRTDDDPPSFR
jgi:MFS superfamily sulfate permease-like transporter